MKRTLLRDYARLIVHDGLSLDKGQIVLIKSSVETYDFTRMVVEECYRHGAGQVLIDWVDNEKTRIDLKKANPKLMASVYPYEESKQQWINDTLPAYLWLDSDDPDALVGVDQNLKSKIDKARLEILYPYRLARDNKYQWCIAGVASVKWAKKVFPDAPNKSAAVNMLWEAILKASRADNGHGIANWAEHDEILKRKCKWLNSLHLISLHYKSKNGTDLSVGLNPVIRFSGGGETDSYGHYFQPNIPTEEVFTSPRWNATSGIVYAAKPLVHDGTIIKDFYIKFDKGKVVEAKAKVGQEALDAILAIDEGARYLGEAALVPYDSPINQTGLLFYNTLYDENACCHLALGRGFPNLIPNYEKYSPEEIKAAGVNSSATHVDFMIGSSDLSIVGQTKDGRTVKIFENGTWASQ